MTHQSHRFAIATCKRPDPSVTGMYQRQRRRRSGHG